MMIRWAMAALLAITVAGCVPPYHHRHHDGWGWNDRDRDDRDHDNDCRRWWCDND